MNRTTYVVMAVSIAAIALSSAFIWQSAVDSGDGDPINRRMIYASLVLFIILSVSCILSMVYSKTEDQFSDLIPVIMIIICIIYVVTTLIMSSNPRLLKDMRIAIGLSIIPGVVHPFFMKGFRGLLIQICMAILGFSLLIQQANDFGFYSYCIFCIGSVLLLIFSSISETLLLFKDDYKVGRSRTIDDILSLGGTFFDSILMVIMVVGVLFMIGSPWWAILILISIPLEVRIYKISKMLMSKNTRLLKSS